MTWIAIWEARKEILYGLVIASLFWFGWHLRGVWDESAKARAVAECQTTERQACAHNQKVTEDSDHAYQENIAPIDVRTAADLQRLCRPATLPQLASPAKRPHDKAQKPGLPANSGVDAWTLITRASTCDKQAVQLDGLQTFVRRVWNDNGQPIP
jgi:hypothetical protein